MITTGGTCEKSITGSDIGLVVTEGTDEKETRMDEKGGRGVLSDLW